MLQNSLQLTKFKNQFLLDFLYSLSFYFIYNLVYTSCSYFKLNAYICQGINKNREYPMLLYFYFILYYRHLEPLGTPVHTFST
jgi:hypothetical protein